MPAYITASAAMGNIDEYKVIAIVWVGIIPIAVLLIFLTFVVIGSNKSLRIRDAVVCSLLVTRLGHCGGTVLLVSLHELHNWRWTEARCEAMLWTWIAFFMADILVTVCSTGYHAAKMGRQPRCAGCSVATLLLVSWVAAVALGASPVLTDELFYNYEADTVNHTRMCFLGVNADTDDTLHLGVNMFHVIAILLCIILTIALLAESKVAFKNIKRKRSKLDRESAAPKQMPRGMRKLPPHMDPEEIKDIKYIHYAAVYCTGLFNCAPQLAMYVTDMQLPYSHEVLVSAGLLHSILLPFMLLVMSVRYRRYAARTFCCATSSKDDSSTHADRPEAERSNDVRATHRKMVDRATSMTIPGVTTTESRDYHGRDNMAYASDNQRSPPLSNGHIIVSAAVVHNTNLNNGEINTFGAEKISSKGHLKPRRSNSACIDRRSVVNSLITVKRSSSGGTHQRSFDVIPEMDERDVKTLSVVVEDCKKSGLKTNEIMRRLPKQVSQETYISDHTVILVKTQKGHHESYIAGSFHPNKIEVCSNYSAPDNMSMINNADNVAKYEDDPPPYESIDKESPPGQGEEYSSYYDSDSEAWSNLYAESDIADILDTSQGNNSPSSGRSDRLRVPQGYPRRSSNVSSHRSASFCAGEPTAEPAKQQQQQQQQQRKPTKKTNKSKKGARKKKEVGLVSGLASGAQFGLAMTMQIAKQNSRDGDVESVAIKHEQAENETVIAEVVTIEKETPSSDIPNSIRREKPIRRESSKRVTVIRRVDAGDKAKDTDKSHSRNSSAGTASLHSRAGAAYKKHSRKSSSDAIKQQQQQQQHGRQSSTGEPRYHSRQSSASGIITNGSLVKESIASSHSSNPFLAENDPSYVPSEVNPRAFLQALGQPMAAESPYAPTNPFLPKQATEHAYRSAIGDMDQTKNVYGTLGRRELARNDSLRARKPTNPFLHALDLQEHGGGGHEGSEAARRRQAKARRAWRSAMMAISVVDFLNQKAEEQAVLDTGDSASGRPRAQTIDTGLV